MQRYFKTCEKMKRFQEAKQVKDKLEVLKLAELKRQKANLRLCQERELIQIENSQKVQFFEFSQAWDQFMKDYEATAYLSLDKLKERHKKELEDIAQVPFKLKFSRKVLDLR